ncbi:MAG: hypothetical protein C0407_16415 [Desulfobacca sp.]|nr:hypothetical protein [Desulfobacca sp.]
MRFTKIFLFLTLSLTLGLLGCTTEKKGEAPKQGQVTKNLVPPKTDVKGQNFLLELNELQVEMMVDNASKEITETPKLKGRIKITNQSNDNLEIQGITLEYLDKAGKPIPFTSGEKISKATVMLQAVKPGEITEGSIDATIPRMAIKEKALGKIEVNLVYIPTLLKREKLSFSQKVE